MKSPAMIDPSGVVYSGEAVWDALDKNPELAAEIEDAGLYGNYHDVFAAVTGRDIDSYLRDGWIRWAVGDPSKDEVFVQSSQISHRQRAVLDQFAEDNPSVKVTFIGLVREGCDDTSKLGLPPEARTFSKLNSRNGGLGPRKPKAYIDMVAAITNQKSRKHGFCNKDGGQKVQHAIKESLGYIGMFSGGGMVVHAITAEQVDDHSYDHSDVGKALGATGRFRYNPNRPDVVVWSDEPSKEQMEEVEDFLARRGFNPSKHKVWAWADGGQTRIISKEGSQDSYGMNNESLASKLVEELIGDENGKSGIEIDAFIQELRSGGYDPEHVREMISAATSAKRLLGGGIQVVTSNELQGADMMEMLDQLEARSDRAEAGQGFERVFQSGGAPFALEYITQGEDNFTVVFFTTADHQK